ncbi:MAG: polysaccharide lyase family 7 protein [Gammaproteobacteria bacterium]|nr:polysaccharide lyase family 7 protein [Gammaproteobacteria bacterium]MBU1492011.1 polysaccharide lyase family 7 protein [Gammaproteobacteria bacterium]MBU2065825.1 polysaccharide lyase family 7 protein [Gammaproteobacteria bacterium]MBU2140614.1 polysaccharide lyase family 7 protein [Gammaproteobacteria bacterium]MBU2215907.1 polysaccharide lyase family 7 protein [Gammaproteobacteria bacterium]
MIDLATWNLSIPVGIPAATIDTPLLVNGYQDHYFQSQDGTIRLWAPVNGSTTPNSAYPRSEMRETFADGTLRNWKYPSAANHTLNASLSIEQVPSTGMIAISQIHTKNSNSPPVMLGYQYYAKTGYGDITLAWRAKPTDANSKKVVLLKNVKLGQTFAYTINLSSSGVLSISTRAPSGTQSKWQGTLNKSWASHLLYFKAGVYTLDNNGYETEAGAARFNQLSIAHR